MTVTAAPAIRRIRTTLISVYGEYPYDLQNQRYFVTTAEKRSYMATFKKIYENTSVNYIRDDSVKLSITYDDALMAKYLQYKNDRENRTYYAKVTRVEYVDINTTRIYFAIDWINTLDLNVGDVLTDNTANSVIDREHVRQIEEAKGLYSNVDSGTDLTVHHKSLIFEDYYVFIQSTVSLNGKYGDADAPEIVAAPGQVFDNLPSAQTAYIINLSKFQGLLDDLKAYPWIVKNFTNITLLPAEMINKTELQKESAHDNLYSLKDQGQSTNVRFKDISFTMDELRQRFGLASDGSEDELLRYPHSYIEIVDYSGGYMLVDPAFLPKNGMNVNGITSLGSINELDIYVEEYKNKWHDGDLLNGDFLGTSLSLSSFPLLPIQIDNYQLALASSANSRRVANEAIYFSAATGAISAAGQGLSGNLLGAASGTVNTLSNFYFSTQQQLASYEDKRITPVSLTNQSTNYGNLIANTMFGIHVRFKQNQESALQRVKGDFCYFGFPTKRIGRIQRPDKMSIVDFVKTSTLNFSGKSVPKQAVDTLEQLFSAGVHFWHAEPTSDIYQNKRKEL